jgi:hypothetical protein
MKLQITSVFGQTIPNNARKIDWIDDHESQKESLRAYGLFLSWAMLYSFRSRECQDRGASTIS